MSQFCECKTLGTPYNDLVTDAFSNCICSDNVIVQSNLFQFPWTNHGD